jgi:hypothetical protein
MFGQIRRIAKVHYCYFCSNFIESSIVFELYNSTSVIFSILFILVVGKEDFTHRSFAEFLLEDELSCWIPIDKVYIFDHRLKFESRQQLNFDMTLYQIGLKLLFPQFLPWLIGIL